jgi:hypothetical protein
MNAGCSVLVSRGGSLRGGIPYRSRSVSGEIQREARAGVDRSVTPILSHTSLMTTARRMFHTAGTLDSTRRRIHLH